MKEPWRYELTFVAAVDDAKAAERLLDELVRVGIDVAPTAFCEGGLAQRMDDSDVVPDSPLMEELAQ